MACLLGQATGKKINRQNTIGRWKRLVSGLMRVSIKCEGCFQVLINVYQRAFPMESTLSNEADRMTWPANVSQPLSLATPVKSRIE